jgi:hypothetical protein
MTRVSTRYWFSAFGYPPRVDTRYRNPPFRSPARTKALSRPVGGILRATTADLGLAALAVHYLLA